MINHDDFDPGQNPESHEAMRPVSFHFILSRELDSVPEDAVILGAEATRPATIERCNLGNIDPQHTGGNVDLAAIEMAPDYDIGSLDTKELWMVTDRPDLDALGTMVIIQARVENDGVLELSDQGWQKIMAIAENDKFALGQWHPQELPTRDNPWRDPSEELMAPIAALVSDNDVPLAKRVKGVRDWLFDDQEPLGYREKAEAKRLDLIEALENGTITAEIVDGIAVVNATHPAATTVGYALSPVVVAVNPEFSWQSGEPHTKVTICQFTQGHLDLKAVFDELNEADQAVQQSGNTWGGSPIIGGSPQGISTELATNEIVGVVTKHLIKESENNAYPEISLVSDRDEVSRASSELFESADNKVAIATLLGGDRLSVCEEAVCAKKDGKTIGMITISHMGEGQTGNPSLVGMYVLPEFRKQGIGKDLLEQAIAQGRELGWENVQIDVLTGTMMSLVDQLDDADKSFLRINDLRMGMDQMLS